VQRVRGRDKVLCHLMFDIVTLAAEQLMRFVTYVRPLGLGEPR
jgi:hypothetical protein